MQTRWGVFIYFSSDLLFFVLYRGNDVESFIFMANAYSQRLGAFGGMLYGAIEKDVANHFFDLNFKFAQKMTFHNKEFQELSMFATYELVKSLDYRINLDGLQKYMLCAISNKDEINFPHESYDFIEWDDILSFFDYASTIPIVTVNILNNFINENKLPNIAMRKQLFGENWNKIITDSCWLDRIIEWADNTSVPDLEWVEDSSLEKGGFWSGLPRENDALLSLTELNLSGMSIAELPEEFSKLIKLESLNISYNCLTKLPSKIGDLSNLKSLDIRCEKLYCVPDSIINLVNLRYLGFYDITHLCDSKLTHEFYMNWVYNLLKDGCDISMGKVTDMSHIDEKCPPNIMYLRIDQDSWKRAPTRMEFDGGQVIKTRYVESEDKFIRK